MPTRAPKGHGWICTTPRPPPSQRGQGQGYSRNRPLPMPLSTACLPVPSRRACTFWLGRVVCTRTIWFSNCTSTLWTPGRRQETVGSRGLAPLCWEQGRENQGAIPHPHLNQPSYGWRQALKLPSSCVRPLTSLSLFLYE